MSSPATESLTLDPRLLIKKLTWDLGNQLTEVEFGPGFNLLSDGEQSDRTILLRLIRYAMGANAERIDRSIQHATEEVRLEFEVNDHLIVTRRGFQHPTGQLSITIDSRPQMQLTPNEVKSEILRMLAIPIVRYQSGRNVNTLSFDDLARAFVVDRDFSYAEILNKMYPTPRQETVRMMLGLITQEIADMELSEQEATNRITEIQQEITGIRRMLRDFQVGELLEIQNSIQNLQQFLVSLDDEENELRQSIANDVTSQYRSDQYSNLREELIEKRTQLQNIESDTTILSKQISDKRNLRELLEEEVLKLERHSSSQYVLSSFSFSRCPRCLRSIEDHMVDREVEGKCMLCNRPLQQGDDFDLDAWEKSRRDMEQAIREVDQLLTSYQRKFSEYTKEKTEILVRVRWLESQLASQTANYVSPYIEDISLISQRKAQVLRQIDRLEGERRQREYLDAVRDEELPAKEKELEGLKTELRALQTKRGSISERTNAFLKHFRYFLQMTGVPTNDVSWDKGEWLPLIGGQRHTQAKTGPDLTIVVLAFHYGLLALPVKEPKYDTAHPKMIIIDEPEQQNMEQRQFRRIMQELVNLAEDNEEQVQIIVAATNSQGLEDYLVKTRTIRR